MRAKKNQQLLGDWETGRKGKGKTCQQCFRVSELVNVEPGSEMSTATCHVLQPVISARGDSGSRWNGGICPHPERKKKKGNDVFVFKNVDGIHVHAYSEWL